jgi:predicted outer membrane protein
MMINLQRYGLLLASVISCATLAACDDDDELDEIDELDDVDHPDEVAELVITEGETQGEALAAQADAELAGVAPKDAVSRISAILLEIDQGEIAHSQIELDAGADPVARDFAAQMIDEHSRHDELVDDLLVRRSLSAVSGGVTAELRAGADAGIDVLTRESQVSVDFRYLRVELQMHVTGEVLVDSLINNAPDAEVEAFLVVTRDLIAAHREEAEALLRGW